MNYEAYIIYGWEELSNKIIDNEWLINNHIKIYSLQVCNIEPKGIIYGLISEFNNSTGKININNDIKTIVQTAFGKVLQNNIKLEYFIALDTNINYYNYYIKYNPDENLDLDSNYTTTDVPDDIDIIYDVDSN